MSRALSPKVLRELRDRVDSPWVVYTPDETARLLAAIDDALKPKRGVTAARKQARAKRATRKEKAAEVRSAVVERAGGRDGACCEACGAKPYGSALEMDHFRSGAHKRSNESVTGCWLLCVRCHKHKTLNEPSRLHWLSAFREHCRRNRYEREARETERLMDALFLSAASAGDLP